MINRFGRKVQAILEEQKDEKEGKGKEKQQGEGTGELSNVPVKGKGRKGSAPFKSRNAVSPTPIKT